MVSYKHLSIYVLCCITLSLLSCNKEKSIITENSINFSAIENYAEYSTNTKGTPITSINSINNFGIVAHYNSGGSINNSFMNNINVYKSGSSFIYSPTLKWPNSGTISFYGYAPYSSTDNGINITTTNGVAELEYNVPTDVTKQPDIMVATPQLDKDGSDPTVCISFNHALTAIGFSAQGNGNNITKIAFKNIYTKGKTDLIKGDLVWYDLESSSNEYLSGIKNGKFTTSATPKMATNSNGYLMMIPQTVPEGGTIVFVIDSREISKDISGDKWEAGQIITYNYNPRNYWLLRDFASNNYPSSNFWDIMDTYPDLANDSLHFQGLRDALANVSETTDREITIRFPNLTTLAPNSIGKSYEYDEFKCLKNINLPEVISVQENALHGCTHLETIHMPKVIEIKDSAFAYCENMRHLDAPQAISIGVGAFKNCFKLGSVNLSSVKFIDHHAFNNCYVLGTINLPSAITLSNNVFSNCSNLGSVGLLNTVNIGEKAFKNCIKLSNVNIPKLECISNQMFYMCENLINIYLPSVEKIYSQAFYNCLKLVRVEVAFDQNKQLKYLHENSFTNTNTNNITLRIKGVGDSLAIENNSIINKLDSSIIETFMRIEVVR